MGTLERREREKEERRNSILDAAERVFFSKGVREATVEEIAGVAELSKGTLYLYFKSKEAMYFGITLRALRILKGMFETVMASDAPGIEKVRSVGRAYHEFSQRYPDYFDAMMHFDAEVIKPEDAGQIGLECHAEGMEVLGLVARGIGIGIEDGSIRGDLDPMKTAILLWAQTDGVIRVVARKCKHMEEFDGLDLQDLVEDFFRLTYRALKPSAGETGSDPSSGSIGGNQ